MNKAFQKALEDELIEPVTNFNGGPFIVTNADGKPVQYYQACDGGISMLMGRFRSFGDTLRKHDSLKISDELLTTSLLTLSSLFRRVRAQAQQDVDQVFDAAGEGLILIERLEERRALGADLEQLFEIASIFYFSEEEHPGVVDNQVNRSKIRDWLRAPNCDDITLFFSTTAIGKFVPLKALLETDTLTYLQNLTQLELLDWTRTKLLSKQFGMTSDTISTIESRVEILHEYDGLMNVLLNRTTSS